MRFAIIGSGSKGNALIVQSGRSRVIIDCGYSAKEIRRRLRILGEDDLRGLNGLLITHGHNDHIKGAGTLAGGMGLRTFATAQTQDFCARRKPLQNHVVVESGKDFSVGEFSVTPFSTVHDAKGSCGFVLTDGKVRLGVCTDLGCVTEEVILALSGLDALYLEFNYDEQMLQSGPYPAHLKRRIMSRYGHLSNEESAFLLEKVAGSKLKQVVLAHLSESNNTEHLALAAAKKSVRDEVKIAIAPQSQPSPWFEVGYSDFASKTKDAPNAGNLAEEIASVLLPVDSDEKAKQNDNNTMEPRADFAKKHPGQALRDVIFGKTPSVPLEQKRFSGAEIAARLEQKCEKSAPKTTAPSLAAFEKAVATLVQQTEAADDEKSTSFSLKKAERVPEGEAVSQNGIQSRKSTPKRRFEESNTSKSLAVKRQLSLFEDAEITSRSEAISVSRDVKSR